MKKLACLLAALFLFTTCLPVIGEKAPALRVGALKGPTAIGLVKLMKEDEGKGDYAFTLAASPDALLPALARGELDIACLPVNLAAILSANTQGAVRVININTLGVLYLVEQGESIKMLQDLAGRTIYASGMSSTPEYALRHLLEQAGVTNVTLSWKAEHAEALAALLVDEKGVAMLPQPFVAAAQAQNPGIRIALDLNAEWEKLGQGALITGVTVARAEVLEKNPDAIAAFQAAYALSAAFANENHAETAKLIDAYGIIKEAIALKALPYCGITHVEGAAMRDLLVPFFQMLFDRNPASTGGSLPDEAFYFVP